MRKTRKSAAAALAVFALSLTAAPALAGAFTSDHKCAPGQHGNPHPGFKPGSCK